MLALERPDALILVARNCHHSTINAIKAFGLDFRFLPSPYDPRVRGRAAAERRPGGRRRSRATRRRSRSSTRRRPTRACAPTRIAIAAAVHDASDHAMLFVDEAWGGHLHFHPELPPSAMDAGADICRAVDAQARRRAAADGADPLARGPRRLRADGGGVPRVRHDEPELPPARLRRRRRALARGDRARGARRLHRPHARPEGGAARAAAAAAPPRRPGLGRAPLRPCRGLRQGQDDRRAERLRLQRLRGLRGARRARDRGREGRRQHGHADHDLPARGGRGRGDRDALEEILAGRELDRRAPPSRCRRTRSGRSTTAR